MTGSPLNSIVPSLSIKILSVVLIVASFVTAPAGAVKNFIKLPPTYIPAPD